MKTCKECIHYGDCSIVDGRTRWYGILKACEDVERKCLYFKDKLKFVELPCKVGDTVYTVIECEEPFIDEGYINSICFEVGNQAEIYVRYNCGLTYWYEVKDAGKQFFFSKEDAEKSIKGGTQ